MWGPGWVRKIDPRVRTATQQRTYVSEYTGVWNYEDNVEEKGVQNGRTGGSRHSPTAKTRGLNAQLMSCKVPHNYTANLEEIYANQSIFFPFAGNYHKHSQCSCAFCFCFCAFLSLSVCFLARLWERDYFHSPY